MLPNIGVCGKLRSGKDTVAAYLCGHYGYTRFAFGDGLRDICHMLYPDKFENGAKPRALLQGFGQDARKYDELVWVRYMFDEISTAEILSDEPLKVVVSDLRQPVEYYALKARGYVIIRVNAPDEIRLERARAAGDVFDESTLNHETERFVDTFAVDYEIHNGGSLALLYAQIDRITAELGAKKVVGE